VLPQQVEAVAVEHQDQELAKQVDQVAELHYIINGLQPTMILLHQQTETHLQPHHRKAIQEEIRCQLVQMLLRVVAEVELLELSEVQEDQPTLVFLGSEQVATEHLQQYLDQMLLTQGVVAEPHKAYLHHRVEQEAEVMAVFTPQQVLMQLRVLLILAEAVVVEQITLELDLRLQVVLVSL
jgi:hypothetical protein